MTSIILFVFLLRDHLTFLDYYLNEMNGHEDYIIISRKEVPNIWYTGEDNKRHRYFCDFYIKNTNTIVEVKSFKMK